MKLLREEGAGFRLRLGENCSLLVRVAFQQNTTCYLHLHCCDDPIDEVLAGVSPGVNNPISGNSPLLSDSAEVE